MAGEVHDPRLVDRAARALAAAPGGPSLGEARRRLTQGLPLIVGVAWAEAEALQDQLVKLGLVPRLGPAPDGTEPLRGAAPTLSRRALWLGLAGGTLLVTIVLAWRPGRVVPTAPGDPQPSTPVRLAPVAPRARSRLAPSAGTAAADAGLVLWARVQLGRDGLQIEGWASVPYVDPLPEGPLTLAGRVGGRDVLDEALPVSRARARRDPRASSDAAETLILSFRLPLERERVGSAEQLVLEATWDDWRAEPLTLEIPQP